MPHSLQNFATVGITDLQLWHSLVSTPAGGTLLQFWQDLALGAIIEPQCMQYLFFATKFSVIVTLSSPSV